MRQQTFGVSVFLRVCVCLSVSLAASTLFIAVFLPRGPLVQPSYLFKMTDRHVVVAMGSFNHGVIVATVT